MRRNGSRFTTTTVCMTSITEQQIVRAASATSPPYTSHSAVPVHASSSDHGHSPHSGAPEMASRVWGSIRSELATVPTMARVNELATSTTQIEASALANTIATGSQALVGTPARITTTASAASRSRARALLISCIASATAIA